VGCDDDGEAHHFLRLSCFDGAHAFLFSAEVNADGTLAGGFWSGAQHSEAWSARRDPAAALPDELALTRVVEGLSLAELAFPQVFPLPTSEKSASYPLRSLGDPAFAGRARLVQIFGSWCPNCHDACALLAELHQRYGPRGLAIQGLAFELGNDLARDAVQVQRYAARHGISWPLFLAGPADKQRATESLRLLDRVRAYPTTLFLDREGRVRYVLTGFSGPATGAEHARQRARIERLIEELLAGG
ncbi:MAG: TlpA family protein disulfide reductase, partial [Planctomycetes bacterium]|nr:TlpA family protein disulfide reductase [Planctomycetota bacterium]